jgi:protein TonB
MKEKKDHQFIKKPIYPGGNKAFREFIYGNLKYPKEAIENKTEGIVLCKYEIDYKGNVSKVKVKKGIGHGCDQEAVRILKLLKWEIPKEPRKLRVSFNKETKIKFTLPKVAEKKKVTTKPKPKVNSIQYTITKKNVPTKEPNQKKKSTTYTYTIKL